jgi:hypothetical protein
LAAAAAISMNPNLSPWAIWYHIEGNFNLVLHLLKNKSYKSIKRFVIIAFLYFKSYFVSNTHHLITKFKCNRNLNSLCLVWLPSTWPSRRRRNCQGENVWSSSHVSIHPGTSSCRAHLRGWNMVRMIEFQDRWNLTDLADPLLASTISRLVIFWNLEESSRV